MRTIPSARALLPFLLAAIVATPAAAQSHDHPAAAATAPDSTADARRAFALVKSLAGRWQGHVVEPTVKLDAVMDLTLRVTSRGNALVHEMRAAEPTDDNPVKNDHPVTVMYLDGPRLVLTHFCDAGNRPRMVARVSPDGKQVDFDFLDVAGPTAYGHMQHARFTIVDADHHIEEWTYERPNGKAVTGHFELHRVAEVATLPGK